MKKPFVLIAAIVAVVSFGAAVAVGKDTTRIKTSVSIKSEPNTSLSGRVKAKQGCKKQRKVSLHLGSQVDGRLPSDDSDNRGRYRIFPGEVSGFAHYWVVVHREIIKKDNERILCERARSKKIATGPRGNTGATERP